MPTPYERVHPGAGAAEWARDLHTHRRVSHAMTTLPTYQDVLAAAQRLDGQAHRTPVLRSSRLDAQVGSKVFVKCESFQRAGAFKFRGAFNALARLEEPRRRAGVVAYSSGNHAQAVALAARLLAIPATIVMPHDAPETKVAATLGYGAEVVRYDRYTEDREAIGRGLATERGLTLVPPYDHPDVIAGQGTVALELLADAGPLDALVTPLGGGGLLAGCALAARALCPSIRLYGVEPAAGDDGRQSLEQGRIVHITTPRTIADGAQTLHLGELTFPIIRREVSAVLTATDDELVAAMRLAAQTLKIVIEPTAALGLAAVLFGKVPLAEPGARLDRVGVVLSGGNIDLERYGRLVAAGV